VRVMGHTFGETVAEFSERFGCARLLPYRKSKRNTKMLLEALRNAGFWPIPRPDASKFR